MIRNIKTLPFAALVAGLVLSACSSGPDTQASIFIEYAPDIRALTRPDGDTDQGLRPTAGFPGLDPAVTAGHTDPLLGAYIASRAALAGLSPVEAAGGIAYWRTAENAELALSNRGMLIATRGLGADLQAANARQTETLIAEGRSGTAERRHGYLDGRYLATNVTLTCTVTRMGEEDLQLNNRRHRTIRFEESCTGADEPVVNSYWRDAAGSGLIRQSIQWIGPGIGSVHLQRLVD